jgi:pyruvate/2-oxoglutarate dehydrogenase complex dihydrolipoamide acyltransferase (E2) component
MATQVLLPQLAFTMTEGTISEWYAADGDQIVEGKPLYALEAEKAVQDIDSPASGVLKILVDKNQTVEVGRVLAEIS